MLSLKAEAVLLYFKGFSLRAVRVVLLHKGYEVSIETIWEWFHFVHLLRRRHPDR
jgi:transposase-like protein